MYDLTMEGVEVFPPISIWSKPQREVCVVPSSSRTLGEALVAVLAVPQGMPVLGGVEGCSQDGYPKLAFPCETTRAGLMREGTFGQETVLPTAQQN